MGLILFVFIVMCMDVYLILSCCFTMNTTLSPYSALIPCYLADILFCNSALMSLWTLVSGLFQTSQWSHKDTWQSLWVRKGTSVDQRSTVGLTLLLLMCLATIWVVNQWWWWPTPTCWDKWWSRTSAVSQTEWWACLLVLRVRALMISLWRMCIVC